MREVLKDTARFVKKDPILASIPLIGGAITTAFGLKIVTDWSQSHSSIEGGGVVLIGTGVVIALGGLAILVDQYRHDPDYKK